MTRRARFYPEYCSGSSRGFSLIELLVVLVILGLISTLVVPAILNKLNDARYKAAGNQISRLAQAVEMFEFNHGRLPTSLAELVEQPGDVSIWSGPYVEASIIKDPWGRVFLYRTPGPDNRSFEVYSYAKDGMPGGEQWDIDLSNISKVDPGARG